MCVCVCVWVGVYLCNNVVLFPVFTANDFVCILEKQHTKKCPVEAGSESVTT